MRTQDVLLVGTHPGPSAPSAPVPSAPVQAAVAAAITPPALPEPVIAAVAPVAVPQPDVAPEEVPQPFPETVIDETLGLDALLDAPPPAPSPAASPVAVEPAVQPMPWSSRSWRRHRRSRMPVAQRTEIEAFAPEPPALPVIVEGDVKSIGDLQAPTALYNVYLGDVDGWSSRLAACLQDWAQAPAQPVLEEAVALAHSLAGSSATVGFTALSHLARTLEHALRTSSSC